jgi:hypothetical protein
MPATIEYRWIDDRDRPSPTDAGDGRRCYWIRETGDGWAVWHGPYRSPAGARESVAGTLLAEILAEARYVMDEEAEYPFTLDELLALSPEPDAREFFGDLLEPHHVDAIRALAVGERFEVDLGPAGGGMATVDRVA